MGQRHVLVGVSMWLALWGTTAEAGLSLRWCDPHGLFEQGFEGTGREVQKVFETVGVELAWQRCPTEGEVEGAGREIRVLLVKSAPTDWGLSSKAMGAVLSQQAPQSHVYIFFDTVARAAGYSPEALRGRWPTAREKRDLARAMSRVVAHEVFHAVLPSRPHAGDGVTHFQLDREALLSRQVALDPAVAEAFRSALSQTAAAAAAPEP